MHPKPFRIHPRTGTLIVPDHAPKQCGIYFLYYRRRLTYVGRSMHVQKRVQVHARRKRFDAWLWCPCEPDLTPWMEYRCISELNPPKNMDTAAVMRSYYHDMKKTALRAVMDSKVLGRNHPG